MNTYYSIVIETYFIWSWARNASFWSLKNLNSTAVCGTAILKALQNDLPYKFCFWPFKNFKCGNKDEFMITFSSQRFKQQKRSFPFLKVMSSLWILLPNNNSNSCSIYTSKFCEVHLFDGNPLPTYRHTALLQPEALKMRKFSATQELKVQDDIIRGQTPKPSLKANSTTDWGTDWWWHTYSSRGWSPGRSRLGSTEESIMN